MLLFAKLLALLGRNAHSRAPRSILVSDAFDPLSILQCQLVLAAIERWLVEIGL